MSFEFDNWDNSSASDASPGVGGLGKCVILAAVAICCSLAVMFLRTGKRARPVSANQNMQVPKKNRQKWEAIKHLAYQGPGSKGYDRRARRNKNGSLAKVAARVYDQRQSKLPDTRSPQRSTAVNQVMQFAASTQRWDKNEQRAYLNVELHAQRVLEMAKDTPRLHKKLTTSWTFPFSIKSLTVAGVQNLPDKSIHVFTYCIDSSGESWRVRFDCEEGGSRIYDWFLYDWMVSSSDRNAEFYAEDPAGVPYFNWRWEIDRIGQALKLEDFTNARKLLLEAERHKVPADMMAEFLLRNGRAWESLGFCGKAMQRYRAAGKLSVPGADRRRVWFFLSQKAYRHCYDAARNYRSALGGGAWILKIIADVKTSRYGPALDYDPDDLASLIKFATAMGPTGFDAIIARIQKSSKPSQTFAALAGHIALVTDPPRLSLLRKLLEHCEQNNELKSKPEQLAALKAFILRSEGKYADSLKTIGDAWQKSKPLFALRFILKDAWLHRRAKQAYEASPDQPAAYRELYRQYLTVASPNLAWKKDVWRQLTKRHEELFKEDAAIGFVKAQLLTPRNDVAKRTVLLTASFNLAKAAKDNWLPRIRRKLGELLIFQKKVDKAVQIFGTDSVRDLAKTCVRFRRWQQLKVLLQLGEEEDGLSYFRAELAWANDRPKSALEHLRKATNEARPFDDPIDGADQRGPTRLLARIHVHNRTVMTAYKESSEKIRMFRALVAELRKVGDDKTLQRLARIHEKQNIPPAEKAWSVLNRFESRWHNGNFKQLAHELINWPPTAISHFSVEQRNRLADRCVRAWIRSLDRRAASKAATGILNTTGQTFPLVLAHTAQQDKRKALKAFTKGWTPRPTTADLLFDPELSKAMGRKNSAFIREEPLATPEFLSTLSIRLLQNEPSKLDQARLYRKIPKLRNKTRILKPKRRIIRRRKPALQKRTLPFLAFRTNAATFTVNSKQQPVPLDQVELSAYGDPQIAKRLRDHKAHLSVTLHGYQGRDDGGEQIRQLLDVVRSLINDQTTILVVNERAIDVDRRFRQRLRLIKTLAEFDDNGVQFHVASPSFSPIDLNKHRQFQQKLAKVLKHPPRQVGLRVAIRLGLHPVSEEVWVMVNQIDRKNGRTVLLGKLASGAIYRSRLRRGTPVSVDPADVTQWRTKKKIQ